MPRLITLVLCFITAILCGSLLAANFQPTAQSLNKMPLAFTKNMGQWDDRVLFRANSGGATMWFTKDGITYQFTRRVGSGNSDSRGTLHVPAGTRSVPLQGTPQLAVGDDHSGDTRDSVEQLVLTAKYVGANPNPEVIADGQLEYRCNYFLGNDPAKWHTDVPNYEAITIKDIYPGIDLRYSGDGSGQAAYEFIVAPGANIALVKVEYEGAEETLLNDDGRLILKTKWGDMTAAIKSPTNGVLSGTGSFSQLSEKTIGFETSGANRQALGTQSVGLVYSTYLGGGSYDVGLGIVADGSGNAYVTGLTHSTSFPTQNHYQTDPGDGTSDVFVTKLSAAGNVLLYSTYLGGGSYDEGWGIAVDGSGNAYVTGYTNSTNFPTQNPYQTDPGGSYDVFVTKLSAAGNVLLYSTYLGGRTEDYGRGIAVDGSGNAYVTGYTGSSSFPTLNPLQAIMQGSWDAFVTKLSATGNSLLYSTYLGGGTEDDGRGIAVDGSGNAYVTGYTTSANFPTQNPYQTDPGDGYSDVFVTKLSATGNNLVYSTYLGGGSSDFGYGIAVDGSGTAYVTGRTTSTNFPTQNPYQTDPGDGYSDVFVTKLSATGNSLLYSTYLGGGTEDHGRGIAVDGSGNAYVTGYTNSSNFPTQMPYQTHPGDDTWDVFVTKLSAAGNNLLYSTYLGGWRSDLGCGIVVDASGNAYVTGYTNSTNFPTQNPYQTDPGDGTYDVFMTKLSWTPYFCGDVNDDGQRDLRDLVYLRNYVLFGGPAPQSLSFADVDCSGSIDIADVIILANYFFRSGPIPCTECE